MNSVDETAKDETDTKTTPTKKRKSTWIAYLCLFIGGLFGLHLFYLRRDRHAFLHWVTFGGVFGCGVLRDFVFMKTYVAQINLDPSYVKIITEKKKKYKKPPFSIAHYLKLLSTGYLSGMLFWFSIPNEGIGKEEVDLTWLRCFAPIAIALGIHTYGNMDEEKGTIRASLVSGFVALLLAYLSMDDLDGGQLMGFTAFVAATVFTLVSRQWKEIKSIEEEEKHKPGFFRRIIILSFWGIVAISLLSSGIYFNLKVTDHTGEKVKFRDAAKTIFSRQTYEQIFSAYTDFRNFYDAHGWEKVFDQVYDQLDYSHEDKARKILGVSPNASKEMIVSRWRELSKQWHPDRHRDPKMKEEAQNKFMDFQAAYQTLVKIRGKFKAAKGKRKDEF